jgi:hypothetical protein
MYAWTLRYLPEYLIATAVRTSMYAWTLRYLPDYLITTAVRTSIYAWTLSYLPNYLIATTPSDQVPPSGCRRKQIQILK